MYLDGAVDGSGAAAFSNATLNFDGTPTTNDRIGGLNSGMAGDFFDGSIQEIALWAGDIGLAGHQQYTDGFSPLLIRPDILVAYWKLIGRTSPEIEIINGINGTINGTVTQTNQFARVSYPSPRHIVTSLVAAPAGIPILRRRIEGT